MLLYLIQIFSFLAVIIASICKNKNKLLKWVCTANISNFLVMLLAQETDGWANSLATVLRGLIFTKRSKFKTNIVLYFCVILHIGAFFLSYRNPWSILLLCATLMVCISQWFGTPLQIKIFALLSIICWIIYTVHIKLWLDLPKRIIEGVFLIISIMNILKTKTPDET